MKENTATSQEAALYLFQSVARALLHHDAEGRLGSSTGLPRPGLPIEIVRIILRHSDFIFRAPRLDVNHSGVLQVTSVKWTPVRELYFESPPLSLQTLNAVASVQLGTMASHQGWVTYPLEGSWSWFELAILKPSSKAGPASVGAYSHEGAHVDWSETPPEQIGEGDLSLTLKNRIRRRENGQLLTWESHRVPVDTKGYSPLVGKHFTSEHELFRLIQAGDSIGVLCCAQRRFWKCSGKTGILFFKRFFEPIEL